MQHSFPWSNRPNDGERVSKLITPLKTRIHDERSMNRVHLLTDIYTAHRPLERWKSPHQRRHSEKLNEVNELSPWLMQYPDSQFVFIDQSPMAGKQPSSYTLRRFAASFQLSQSMGKQIDRMRRTYISVVFDCKQTTVWHHGGCFGAKKGFLLIKILSSIKLILIWDFMFCVNDIRLPTYS